MKQNLGKLDRIFRFVLGLFILSPFSPQFPSETLDLVILLLGLWVLLESLIGWCGLHDLFGINNKNQ